MAWPSDFPRFPTLGRFLDAGPGVNRFIVLVALANAVLYHRPLYAFAIAHLDFPSVAAALTVATLLFLATLATVLILALVSLPSRHLLKPLCMLGAMGNAV